jgi:hypothetical protein
VLTEEQATGFLAQLRALKPSPGSHRPPDSLGYRGFVVTANGGTVGGYDKVIIYRGLVFTHRGDREETFVDSQHAMEHKLLDSSKGNVPESVLQYIKSEIEQ